jgi:hypothetical protein
MTPATGSAGSNVGVIDDLPPELTLEAGKTPRFDLPTSA